MRFFFIVLVFVLETTSAYAESISISGTVLDSQTFIPIQNATIQIEEQTTITDAIGHYVITTQHNTLSQAKDTTDKLVLMISAEGYLNTQKNLAPIKQSNIVILLDKQGQSGEIIEIIEKTPIQITTPGQTDLSQKELLTIPGARGDPISALRSLPSVGTTRSGRGAGQGNIVIRGSAPEDSSYLVDGIRIPLLYHFGGITSVIPSNFIEDIVFFPGGFGANEGSSTAGLVEIQTKSSQITQTSGFFEFSFIDVAAYLETPITKTLDLKIGLRRSIIDLILPFVIPEDAGLDFVVAPRYYDGQLRLDWRPHSNHRFAFFGFLSSDRLELLFNNQRSNDPKAMGAVVSQPNFQKLMATWSYKNSVIDNRLVAAGGPTYIFFELGEDFGLDIAAWDYTLRDDLTWKFHDLLSLKTGLNIRWILSTSSVNLPLPSSTEDPGNPPNLSFDLPVDIQDQEQITSIYANYAALDITPSKFFQITPSVRLEYYAQLNRFELMPRLSTKMTLSQQWIIRGSTGVYTRAPENAEALNTTLHPERSNQYVIGVEYNPTSDIKATLNGFYIDRSQLVQQDDTRIDISNPIASDVYVNTGSGHSYGFESLLRARYDNFFGWLAYTISRSEIRISDDQPLELYRYDQTHNLIAVASYQIGPWTLGGRWQYATGIPITPYIGSRYNADLNYYTPIIGDVNSERIEDSHRLDMRIDYSWRFDSWDLSAFLDVTNVYLNPAVLSYQYNFDYTEKTPITDIPILPALGIRGTF